MSPAGRGQRARRRGRSGAISVLVVAVSGWLLALGLCGQALAGVLLSAQRAQSAADSAAHAAVAELLVDPAHDEIALLVERAPGACWYAAAPAWATQGAGLDRRCGPAVDAAVGVVRQTARAQLLRLALVADPRDNQAMTGESAGRIEALALVAVARGLPFTGAACDRAPDSGSTACFAVAESAAQEA